MQSSKTEGRSSNRGQDEETWSGAKARSGSRRSVQNNVLEGSACRDEIWQRVSVEELVKRRLGNLLQLGGTGESDDLSQNR